MELKNINLIIPEKNSLETLVSQLSIQSKVDFLVRDGIEVLHINSNKFLGKFTYESERFNVLGIKEYYLRNEEDELFCCFSLRVKDRLLKRVIKTPKPEIVPPSKPNSALKKLKKLKELQEKKNIQSKLCNCKKNKLLHEIINAETSKDINTNYDDNNFEDTININENINENINYENNINEKDTPILYIIRKSTMNI